MYVQNLNDSVNIIISLLSKLTISRNDYAVHGTEFQLKSIRLVKYCMQFSVKDTANFLQ